MHTTNLSYNNTNIMYRLILTMFLIGGTTGIILANSVNDITLHDTYYVVCHFHFILSLVTMLSILKTLQSYVDVIFNNSTITFIGTNSDSGLVLYHLLYIILGTANVVVFHQIMGFTGLTRRYNDSNCNNNTSNVISSLGLYSILISLLVLKRNNSTAFKLIHANHKRIGISFIIVSVVGLIISLSDSIMIRLEHDSSTNRFFSYDNINLYLLVVTLHGLVMIFWMIMPLLLGGYGNILLPLVLTIQELIYPRNNQLSLSVMSLSLILVILCVVLEHNVNLGWTLYPPLSTLQLLLATVGFLLVISSLVVNGISSTITSMNFLMTTHTWKTLILTITNVHFILTAILTAALLLVLVLPSLTVLLFTLISDVTLNTTFYDVNFGGDPVFYQHIFWFFGHPEVYILILPSFGILTSYFYSTNNIIFSPHIMLHALFIIALIGLVVWSHHMYTVNLELDTRSYFVIATLTISYPTGCKLLTWLTSNTYGSNINSMHLKQSVLLLQLTHSVVPLLMLMLVILSIILMPLVVNTLVIATQLSILAVAVFIVFTSSESVLEFKSGMSLIQHNNSTNASVIPMLTEVLTFLTLATIIFGNRAIGKQNSVISQVSLHVGFITTLLVHLCNTNVRIVPVLTTLWLAFNTAQLSNNTINHSLISNTCLNNNRLILEDIHQFHIIFLLVLVECTALYDYSKQTNTMTLTLYWHLLELLWVLVINLVL